MSAPYLERGSERLQLGLSPIQLAKLERYADLVLECNKTYNLMKAETKDAVCIQHLLDSLAAVPHIKTLTGYLQERIAPADLRYADIGSGGGCPGIPLSVAFPEIHFTLVERMERRCAFLESCIQKMELPNATVLCAQANTIEENRFHLVVFRAFHPFEPKIARLLLNMTKPGGYIAAYKARQEKIVQEMETVKKEIPAYTKISMNVPFLEDHERNLVVIQKPL